MRASNTLRAIMVMKDVSVKELSERTGKKISTIYGTFSKDSSSKGGGMTFQNVAEYAEALGCEIIIRDKETDKEY